MPAPVICKFDKDPMKTEHTSSSIIIVLPENTSVLKDKLMGRSGVVIKKKLKHFS